MSCLPGMPCYTTITYPSTCGVSRAFYGYPITSDLLCYAGPVLPNTGIASSNTITVALQKIDAELSPASLLEAIILALDNNPTLKAALCSALSDC
jgi:hypothetical protein